MKAFLARLGVASVILCVLLRLQGCTAAQIAAAEADVHAAAADLDALVVAGSANPDMLHAALAKVVSLDPTNKTLLAIQAKGDAAIDAGDLTTLHTYASGVVAVTAPPSAALVPAKQP